MNIPEHAGLKKVAFCKHRHGTGSGGGKVSDWPERPFSFSQMNSQPNTFFNKYLKITLQFL